VLWRPSGEGDGAARLKHAEHLRDSHLGARREHVAELAEYHVEGAVLVGQGLDIAFREFDLDLRQGRMAPAVFDQRGREIEGANLGALTCRGKRRHAGAAADVQHPLPSANAAMLHEPRGGNGGHRLERCKEGPAFALDGLQMGKGIVCHGGCLPARH